VECSEENSNPEFSNCRLDRLVSFDKTLQADYILFRYERRNGPVVSLATVSNVNIGFVGPQSHDLIDVVVLRGMLILVFCINCLEGLENWSAALRITFR
jgi:hypothetical protein